MCQILEVMHIVNSTSPTKASHFEMPPFPLANKTFRFEALLTNVLKTLALWRAVGAALDLFLFRFVFLLTLQSILSYTNHTAYAKQRGTIKLMNSPQKRLQIQVAESGTISRSKTSC